MARCPAHDDRTPSLSVARGNGQPVVLTCHAGCSADAVLDRLGLTWADLCDDNGRDRRPEPKRIDQVYRYHDEAGAELFQVVRFTPKGFAQRTPDGRWGLNGARRVPYRLPELTAAVAAGEPVWIAEGEKDVHALEAAGVAATCNPGGAGKWRQGYDAHFAGADVTVVADRDEPGIAHARDVADRLAGVAAQVRIVLPGAGAKDAAEHLGRGLGLDAFEPADLDDTSPRGEKFDDDDDDDAPAGRAKHSVATQLVQLAEEIYELGVSTDGLAFGLALDGPNVAHPLRGGRLGLRAALADRYMTETGKAASAGALADALLVVEGRCRHREPVELWFRVAPHGDGVVVDLGTPDGRAVIIEPAGWKVVDRSPVTFRRSELTLPLPEPVRAGRDLLAVPMGNITAEVWPLVAGWMVAALLPRIAHPGLLLRGEQGVGKTTVARDLAAVIDPTAAPVRSSPRDVEQWAVAAAGSWVVALDNLSAVPTWFSDALCRAVTGDALVRRKLYSDDDVSVLAFRRVLILTAIDAGALKGDLADRLLPVDIDQIAPTERRTDADLDRDRDHELPAVLGALYDLTADVLAALPKVDLDELPRMADFAKVLAAVASVRPCDANDPLSLYRRLQEEVASEVVEGDPFAEAIANLARAQGTWRGTATLLAKALAVPDPRPKDWPRTPRGVGGALRRMAPALRSVGVEVEQVRTAGAGSRREILLRSTAPAKDGKR